MNDTDKVLQKLGELSSDVKSLQGTVRQLQEGQATTHSDIKQLREGQTALQGSVKELQETGERRGKLLAGIAQTVGTILAEQQAQRMDIRSLHEDAYSLHDELHATKEELKSEILASRAEARRDTIDLKATVVRKLKSHEERIDALEDAAGIPHPDEN